MAQQTEPATSDPKSAAEELVDMVFFAPLGLALECLDRFPELVARGRKQTSFAQSLGKMALGGFGRRTPSSRPEPSTPPSAAGADGTPVDAGVATPPLEDVTAMTAREAIEWIAEVPVDRLGEVEAAERAGKGRVTVLRAIERTMSAS